MSTQSPQLDQADRELLVAYLDGELSPEDSAVVESRLASEARLRHELQELQQAWDALSELPRPIVAEDFTRTTLEMVAVAAQEDVESATIAMPVRRKRYALRIGLLAIAALLGGVLFARAMWPDRNKEIVANLPIIENIEAYRHIGNIDFLRQLHTRLGDRLARISQLDDTEVETQWQDWRQVSQADEAVRRERIAALDATATGNLHAKWKRFDENVTDQEEKQQLQMLHQQLIEDGQAHELFATLVRMGDLLNRHSAGDKVELRSRKSPQEQLEIIEQWIERIERIDRRRPDRLELTSHEKPIVRKWFQENSPRRREGERRPPTQEERRAIEESLRKSLEDLLPKLSDQTQRELGELSSENESTRRVFWRLYEAAMPSWEKRDEELENYFLRELNNDERLRLLLLPEEEMQRELRQQYFGPYFGDGPGRGRGGRGGGGGRRGGGRPDDGPDDDRDDNERGGRERRGSSRSDD
jgi:hypothetical protein